MNWESPLLPTRRKLKQLASDNKGHGGLWAVLALALIVKLCASGLYVQSNFSVQSQPIILEDPTLPREPGVVISVSTSKNETDLRAKHLDATIQERKDFRDEVVDARTGLPIEYTPEEKKKVDTREEEESAEEQAISDFFGDMDAEVPSKDIYPDGESPKGASLPAPKPISDRHVGADGSITRETGRAFGVFRAGAFGGKKTNPQSTPEPTFDKFGEAFGFGDRPLAIRDIDYPEPEELIPPNETAANLTDINGTYYLTAPLCSGKPCKKYGIGGDVVYDLSTGQPVHIDVGPNGDGKSGYDLDRNVDALTGAERPGCGNGLAGCDYQPPDLTWGDQVLRDEWGEPAGNGGPGVWAVGAAIPEGDYRRMHPPREQTIWDPDGRMHADISQEDGVPPPYYTTYTPGDIISPYAEDSKEAEEPWRGTWRKHWDTGSWLAFILIGPVLTTGVASLVYFTRGPALSLLVVGMLALLDVAIFYFG